MKKTRRTLSAHPLGIKHGNEQIYHDFLIKQCIYNPDAPMSWNILPTFRLKITQYSMEDIGIHGDFPTFTLTKITQIFHNNGGAGLVYHLSSPVVKGVSSTPSIFINLPMGKRWEKDIYGFPSTLW